MLLVVDYPAVANGEPPFDGVERKPQSYEVVFRDEDNPAFRNVLRFVAWSMDFRHEQGGVLVCTDEASSRILPLNLNVVIRAFVVSGKDVEATAPPPKVAQRLLRVDLQHLQLVLAEDDPEQQSCPFDEAVEDAAHESIVDQTIAFDQLPVDFLALFVALHCFLGLPVVVHASMTPCPHAPACLALW